ncbi:MAG: histidine phosphatase family protein [Proteobacteria bacterium]|nr:histidine phosphatase family protein [Pseudomonadota bacterium]MBI3496791.1 histidine phosphatase family protein [Pseudomonadota bacterium]
MIPKFVGELRNLNHARFNRVVARLSLKFADEFQERDTSVAGERGGRVKVLHLLRHAKSSWEEAGIEDHDRPLAERGRNAAEAMGRYLATAGIDPGLVLVSSALRTRATFELAAEELAERPKNRVLRDLYLASSAELQARIRALDDALGSVMLIGHNPGMHDLARSLAGSGDAESLKRLNQKYPTGALASLEFPVARWRQVKSGGGRLARFVLPKELMPTKPP